MTVMAEQGRASSRRRSALRLVVVQMVVLSLFVTLFARLWYLQVLGGEAYQAQAAEQSVREIVVQPARGLIVDDMGRPLVANRTSWVVSVDRTLLAKMDAEAQEALLRRVARTVGTSRRQDRGPHAAVRRARLGERPVLERVAVPTGAGRRGRAPGDRGVDPRAERGLPRRAR
jgi:cell division protein FtsI/penicillin-binding protein 2